MASISSTTTGGNWNTTTTWVGGVIPATADNVTIVSGAVVDLAAGATANCYCVLINTSGTLNMGANSTLTVSGYYSMPGNYGPVCFAGATGSPGFLNQAAGSTINSTYAGAITIYLGQNYSGGVGIWTCNGTAASPCVITNANYLLTISASSFSSSYAGWQLNWIHVNLINAIFTMSGTQSKNNIVYFSWVYMDGAAVCNIYPGSVHMDHMYFNNVLSGNRVNLYGGTPELSNLTFGYTTAGARGNASTADITVQTAGIYRINGALFRAASPGITFFPLSTGLIAPYLTDGRAEIDNYGFVDFNMQTAGSNLAADCVAPGIGLTTCADGSHYKTSADSQDSAGYCIQVDPASGVSSINPYDIEIIQQIASGNSISVTAYCKVGSGYSSSDTNRPRIVLDPDSSWFNSVSSVQDVTPGGAWVQLTASSAAVAKGSGAGGIVRIALQCPSYSVSNGWVRWDNIIVQVS